VLVMNDGPSSRIAESMVIDLPRPRARSELLRSARYHELRAHLLDFLGHGARARHTPLQAPSAEPSEPALRDALGTSD
jgi:nitrate/nitrite transport system ATP-binding protein